MRIFISWSGELSHQVAITLKEWIGSCLQNLDFFLSSESIRKGERGSEIIDKELEQSQYAIVCLTPTNLESTWIHYESGAIAKSVGQSNVSPFLFLVDRSNVLPPLGRFQSTLPEKADVKKLIFDINEKMEESLRLKESAVEKTFEQWWPDLESRLNALIDTSRYAYHGLKLNRMHMEKGVVILQHRATHGDMLTKALTADNDVFLLSIMPQNLARAIEGHISRGEFKAKSLRLLMLDDGLPKAHLKAVSDHLGESNDKAKQIAEAWSHWRTLAKKEDRIKLKGYRSTPMFQVTMVVGDWLTLEIIPFGVGTQDRPALFLTRESNPFVFDQISGSLQAIWGPEKIPSKE